MRRRERDYPKVIAAYQARLTEHLTAMLQKEKTKEVCEAIIVWPAPNADTLAAAQTALDEKVRCDVDATHDPEKIRAAMSPQASPCLRTYCWTRLAEKVGERLAEADSLEKAAALCRMIFQYNALHYLESSVLQKMNRLLDERLAAVTKLEQCWPLWMLVRGKSEMCIKILKKAAEFITAS